MNDIKNGLAAIRRRNYKPVAVTSDRNGLRRAVAPVPLDVGSSCGRSEVPGLVF